MNRVLMGLMFFPRGGSAHVARNLAHALPGAGWDASIVSGSLSRPGRPGDARKFYAGLDIHPLDFTAALDAPDPLLADPPFHPSFEEPRGAPDRIFASLDDEVAEHLGRRLGQRAERRRARATPTSCTSTTDAAQRGRRAGGAGRAGGRAPARHRAADARGDGAEPERWAHAEAWAERMRGWARAASGCSCSPRARTAAPSGCWACRTSSASRSTTASIPSSSTRSRSTAAPTGPSMCPRWPATRARVLLYVGRFTAVKRVPLLIEAYSQAQERFRERAPLVLVGGFPDEFEGEHPDKAIERTGAQDVHLAGWHEHAALARFLNAADLVVLPSVAEQFGRSWSKGWPASGP
jgi:glycosyltransferase involved in cell wall biosynthesis